MMETKKTRATVLMPVYNGEKFLGEAIDSILGQTYTDFEFLIIDDGSTDQSRNIVLSYNDNRIELICNSENLGLEKTLNKGIKQAKGEYIARMDCDDISLPQRLQKQIDFMDANPQISVCGSWVKTFGNSNKVWKYPLNHEEICCWLLFFTAFAHPAVIFRKELFLDNKLLYDERQQFERAEDYELWVRISQKHKLANLDTVLLKYRLHGTKVGMKYKQKTVLSSDWIKKNQLCALGVDFSEQEFDLHSRISRWQFSVTEEFISLSGKWLIKIMEKNRESCLYNNNALKKILSSWWWQICQNASGLGLKTWKMFWKLPLSKYASLTQKQKTIFLIKCIFRIKHF